MDVNDAARQLRKAVAKIEQLEEEREQIKREIDAEYLQCAGVGLLVPAIRRLIEQRKMNPAQRQEENAAFEAYIQMLAG